MHGGVFSITHLHRALSFYHLNPSVSAELTFDQKLFIWK